MRGPLRVVVAIVAASVTAFMLGLSPGPVLSLSASMDSWETLVAGILLGLLGLVILAGWGAYMVGSARIGQASQRVGIIILTICMTAAVGLGTRSLIVDGWHDAESWAYVLTILGVPVLGGVILGGLAGAAVSQRR